MAVHACRAVDFHLTDPADPSAAGFAFGFRVAPCRSHASVFDSFHSQQQPVQQQHSGWQQQPQNQQHGGWQQQPQNQQHGGWQQQPQNQQQSPNQQHDGRQQQPPNQQQHGGPQQPPSSNEQQVTNSQHHAVSKERDDEQTDKADGDDADDQEVEPVAPPKEAESKKKLAEEKAAEAKLKEHAEEESKEKEAKAKDEEREKEKIEDKAKEMLKNLPPIPEDDQANHRSWESQLSSKDVKSQMETSREMDALRNKQHAGAFYTEATLLAAPRPRSGFLRFEAPTAPPQHIASVSARASGLREEGNANHRSWEAQLSAEQLKQQMTESRERDLRGTDSSGSTDQDASGASWASSSSSTGSAAASGRRAKSGSSGGKNGDNGGDNGDNGDEDGGEGADGEDQGDTGVKVEMEAETEGGTAGAGASRVVLLPMIRQLGESIGLNSHWQNDIMGINLAMKNSRFPKFFCGRAGARPRPLADDDHPSIQFRYPVKNVSVELTDLGRDGKGEKEVIWSATYSTDKAITDLSGKMRPDGGDQTAYKPPCYAPKTKNRLELRVIADDPLDGTTAEVRAEAIHKKRTDRSIDEVADLEATKVQLIDRDDPMMLERFRTNLCDMYSQFAWRMRPRNLIPQAFKVPFDYTYILSGCENVAALDLYSNRAECPKRLDVISFCDCLCPAMSDIQPYDSIQCPVVIDSYLLFGRLGISNWTLDPACDSELCDAFAARRLHPSCAETKLPGPMECLGMQISQVLPENSPCPWKNHSGELNMMECLNGHRCNIATEGWACCENHRGRGKCPLQFPVMCDTLCSGITEYCCREEGACTPRGCPVILEREIFYKEETTTSTSTTEAGRTGALEEQGFAIRLPQGSWVWLLVLVPLAGGIVWFCYIRYKDRKPTVDSDDGEDASIMGMKLDKFGFFKSYKAENKERDDIKPHVCIVMSDLPDSRPLGLELMELRVIRVHPWGAKHGWQVGDIIVDIAGHPVKTFEELWDRIQVERNRPPVRFTAERWNVAPTVEEKKAAESLDDQVAAKTMKQRVAEDRENRSKSRIASKNIQEEMAKQAAQPRSLGPNAIPGMMQGYDDDEYEDDEDYSYYSEDDSRVMTAQRVNFPTGRFKSRFTAVFEVIENDKDEETSQHRPGTPNVVIEQKPEKKVKVVVQEEAVDTSKPTDDEKTRVFPVDFERRTFHRDKVVFTKDAWGRSVVKVMNPTQRKPDL